MLWILIIGVYIIVALIMVMVMSYMNRNKKEWELDEDTIFLIMLWPLAFAMVLVIGPFFLLWKFAEWCHKMMYNNYHDEEKENEN